MAIYTKAGDKGRTAVFDKKSGNLIKTSKTSRKIRVIGVNDELNSFLGVVKSEASDKSLQKDIREIQENLFCINAIIAGGRLRFSKTKTKKLEAGIDKLEGSLPVLKNFIIYGGNAEASLLFYCRALCRRAERALVSFSHIESVNPNILTYMNRLSDYLFMLAREINSKNGTHEEVWKGGRK